MEIIKTTNWYWIDTEKETSNELILKNKTLEEREKLENEWTIVISLPMKIKEF